MFHEFAEQAPWCWCGGGESSRHYYLWGRSAIRLKHSLNTVIREVDSDAS